jgi:haloalkane dehalogenase
MSRENAELTYRAKNGVQARILPSPREPSCQVPAGPGSRQIKMRLMTTGDVIARHRAAGRFFDAAGVKSFVREEGAGDPVVCIHGVPTSSFLYRKVVADLAARGLRGVTFDLPGLGLADRPHDYDYTWTGLGRFCGGAVDALGLERFHLVVHDIGGPVGFELAAAMPGRVRSLTLLNTIVEVETFKRPWSMEPFARRGLGEIYLATLTKPAFRQLMNLQGVRDRGATPKEEIYAYVDLLKREDRGRAFLKIMRGFERTAEKRRLYEGVLRDVPYPVQIVWGADDPALKLAVHGEQARRAAGVKEIHTVPAKHFLQEDQAPAIATRVAALAERS